MTPKATYHSCPTLTPVPVYGFGVALVPLDGAEVVIGDIVGELLMAMLMLMLLIMLVLPLSDKDGIIELMVSIPAIVAPGELLEIATEAEGGKLLVDIVAGGAGTELPSPMLEGAGAAEVAAEVPHPNDCVPVGEISMPTELQSSFAKARAAIDVSIHDFVEGIGGNAHAMSQGSQTCPMYWRSVLRKGTDWQTHDISVTEQAVASIAARAGCCYMEYQ